MNYAFRWVVAHICYYLGDWISYLPGWLARLWYPVYNWLMIKSNDLDHDDLGIWHPPEGNDDSDMTLFYEPDVPSKCIPKSLS